ncbi:hypothetical protein ADZ37_23720 [Pannonibacter phragmitetus]|uniref:DUF1850 domain-containing protein n=1 Tax=Pannonibacter phragmitetus TaxID=121719 RepID=UPI00067ADD57|nr:DUF1850 domain-containing protein [Pannonibacter phragmitetus]KND16332.1 hypothetical protein ADZ37_23720 [Pannonibacter phragmitetus]
MSACLLAGALTLSLSGPFTLEWTHSVEKTEWQETWAVTEDGLKLQEARVRGSGAGMEPGDGARLQDGWWIWTPTLPPQPELLLAASGATVSGWTLCADGTCHTIGADASEPVRIAPCG